MVEYDFSGKVAFVTGAARGQGRSHALQYAEGGADVAALDICANKDTVPFDLGTRKELDSLVEEIEACGGRALAIEGDVSDEGAVESAVGEAIEAFDRIDVLANNAGIGSSASLLEMDEAMWDEMIDTNLKGAWLCAKHVGKHMADRGAGGKIVNTASNFAFVGAPMMGHYAAAKHGVVGLTKTLALELAEHDINVNAVAPTAADTRMISGSVEAYGEEVLTEADKLAGPSNLFSPDDPLIEAEDVSEAFMWLSSDASRYVTGTTLAVDAGFAAK